MATDKAAAGELLSWRMGGAADTQKQINQLATQLGVLSSDQKVTGFVEGNAPKPLLEIMNPEAVEVQEQIAEVVQRNLRVILGAQFTEKEGKMLIERAFNPALPQQTQALRVSNLLQQMQAAANAKNAMLSYADANGTLVGYQGPTPSVSDFEAAVSVGGEARSEAQPRKRGRYVPGQGVVRD